MNTRILQSTVAASVFSTLAISAAEAQTTTTATANLAINARIASTCAVSLSQPGTLDGAPGSTPAVSAIVIVNCTNGTAYAVTLGNGGNMSGTTRRLKHTDATVTANNFIPYTLSGSATADTAPLFPTRGVGAAQSTTVWVRASIPAAATVGTYSDTVTVSVTY